jgi:DNA-directed RNA polymerase specialized sigma24 family protein
MAGILALLVDERERHVKADREASKTEVLLSKAGLSIEDIQAASGKNPDAIRKTIQRARAR